LVTDPRVAEHAKIVVNYSCKVKRGEFVVVLAPGIAIPLVAAIAGEVARVGAHMTVLLRDDRIGRAIMLNADDETLSTFPAPVIDLFKSADAIVAIIAPENTKELSDISPEKLGMNMKGMAPANSVIMKKERWCITLHPTQSLAQEAGRSFEDYSDFVYAATIRDWPKLVEQMRVLAERMRSAKQVHIVGKKTDISFSIEGRRPLIDEGFKNLPGGEVFTSPVEGSVNGKVYFDVPFLFLSKSIRGVSLTFVDGEIVEHDAEVGNDLLTEMLGLDEGAKRLGELGIGMNRGITQGTMNTLFDEKMGDTIHMAVGHAFEELGGKNVSAIHIDMVKRIKDGGAIYLDGVPVYENGKFVWE
jgi:aminopeptidase